MGDAHTQTHTNVTAYWWHTSQQEHRFSGFLSCVQTQLSEYRGAWGSGNLSLKFHAHFLSSFFFFIYALIYWCFLPYLILLSLCPIWRGFLLWHRYCHPQPKPEASVRSTLWYIPTHALHMTQSHHRKSPEPEQAGKLWKTRIQFGTYGA